jgi:hypothetical protein
MKRIAYLLTCLLALGPIAATAAPTSDYQDDKKRKKSTGDIVSPKKGKPEGNRDGGGRNRGDGDNKGNREGKPNKPKRDKPNDDR